jgi:hypothetical protein
LRLEEPCAREGGGCRARSATAFLPQERDVMSREELFSCEPALFLVFRRDDGSISWSDYDGKKVEVALPLPGGARCVILLDRFPPVRPKDFKNLFCITRDGTVVWTAKLYQTHDSFVEAELGEEGLIAGTWSCIRVTMNPQTGEVLSEVFTK